MRSSRACSIDGYIVRSELEARWIEFFRRIGVDVIYEQERMPDGLSRIGYLPDLVIHREICMEIKPSEEVARAEAAKPFGYVRETGKALVIAVGPPPGDAVGVITRRHDKSIKFDYLRNFNWGLNNSQAQRQAERSAAVDCKSERFLGMGSWVVRTMQSEMTGTIVTGRDK